MLLVSSVTYVKFAAFIWWLDICNFSLKVGAKPKIIILPPNRLTV